MDSKKTGLNSHHGAKKSSSSSGSNHNASANAKLSTTNTYSSIGGSSSSGSNKPHHYHHHGSRANGSIGGAVGGSGGELSTRKRALLNLFHSRARKQTKFHCEHLEKLKRNGGVKSYGKLCFNLIHGLATNATDLRLAVSKCILCGRREGFVTACLSCIYFACSRRGHFKPHVDETGHALGCDLRTGVIYCYKCCDVIYDDEFDAILKCSAQRLDLLMWLPLEVDANVVPPQVKDMKISNKPTHVSPRTTLGLRGLINLGHTCFMNCIVQVMIHTPLLRNFFLNDRILCNEKHDKDGLKPCIVTGVCDLYQEFYSGKKEALSLHGLLHRMWGNAAHLAGYEQQDAHEFFIAMLDALHAHFLVSLQTLECRCIIDSIFLGKLQSSVVCTVCGNKSIKVDPFWDISLDLPTDDPGAVLTLTDCLNRYTRVEHLGGRIQCDPCKMNQPSTKQLKFKSLPFVLSLHFKRFEHRTSCKKIEQPVDFPEYLDLSEYTSHYDDEAAQVGSAGAELHRNNRSLDCRYSLFGVVNHSGSLQGGHYTAFVRHSRDEWYKCDDHMLTKALSEHVFRSQGYLLFYHKEIIQYHDGRNSAGSTGAGKQSEINNLLKQKHT